MAEVSEPQIDGPSVVLAEDSDDQALVITRTLEKEGFRVRREASAQGLLNSLKRGADEVVLLDLGLPDMHGLEVLQKIVRYSGDIPVIALTALDDIKIVVGAIRMGAWDYVAKRADRSHLKELPDVIRRSQDRRRLLQHQSLALRRLNDNVRERIRAIEKCADELAARHVTGGGQPVVGEIRDSTSGILALVSDFVVARATETGALSLNHQRLSVGAVVGRVTSQQKATITAKNITLDVHTADGLPEINADQGLMEHAVTNLLLNATSSTPAGGTVTVSLEGDADRLVLSVADTGKGITESELQSIFEKSWRLRAASRTSDLRLFVTKAIVEAHGGEICVEGAPGSGSTFKVRLPLGTS
ncbi:MAG: hybrid sensor histidine kinase/response regulator [Candidatus Binatia bacterium]|jgi:signal transduction histidine kinase